MLESRVPVAARHRRPLLFAFAGLFALAVAGCSGGAGVEVESDSGYVSAGGVVEEFAAEGRVAAPTFAGLTADGEEWSSDAFDGEVLVVNFWYASCPPCRVEAPMLSALDAELEEAVFVGVNVRDSAPVVHAFDEEFGIEYPSLLDGDDGMVQLAWAGSITPTAVPTTIVIARDGTIAARISGALPAESVLATIVTEELER